MSEPIKRFIDVEITKDNPVENVHPKKKIEEFRPKFSPFVSREVMKSLKKDSTHENSFSTTIEPIIEGTLTMEKVKRLVLGRFQQFFIHFWSFLSKTIYPAFETFKKAIFQSRYPLSEAPERP